MRFLLLAMALLVVVSSMPLHDDYSVLGESAEPASAAKPAADKKVEAEVDAAEVKAAEAEAEKEGVKDKAAFVKGYHAGHIDGVKESPAAAGEEKKPSESASKTA